MDETVRHTLDDLGRDYAELIGLGESAQRQLRAHIKHVRQAAGHYYETTRTYLLEEALALDTRYTELLSRLVDASAKIGGASADDVAALIKIKKESGDVLRTFQSMLASVLLAGNWQSPSFGASGMQQSGSDGESVVAYKNDYKRDRSLRADAYASAFVKEYVDTGLRFSPFAYVTSSGMSALATVLHNLIPAALDGRVVLAGKTSYFQNKWQLETTFPGRVVYVDEHDTDEILRIAQERRPAIIFFDAICGGEYMPMPNIPKLIKQLSGALSSDTTFILDNTPLATSYQPLLDMPHLSFGRMELVVIESVQKYYEFGFDRASAGILWTSTPRDFSTERMNLGALITDAGVVQLPEPNRTLFDVRLARIGRNTSLLASRLDALAQDKKSIVSHIAYPGLPTHPAHAWNKERPFHGGFFSIVFKPAHRTLSSYDAFIARIIAEAKKKSVDIIAGTTFGFTTTRIYIPARLTEDIEQAYVRVSAGTETALEIEALVDVFAEVMTR